MPPNRALLSIETPKRPIIRIDGQRYELNGRADFGPAELARLAALARAFVALTPEPEGIGHIAEEAVPELARIFRETTALIVRAPADVLDRLTDHQRWQISEAYIAVSLTVGTPVQ